MLFYNKISAQKKFMKRKKLCATGYKKKFYIKIIKL